MTKKDKIWLSPSGVEGMKRCPRCFWLQYHKRIRQPEGIVSRLANRFDKVVKSYFDIYRKTGELPPMIEGQVDGKLENPFNETYFYNHDDKYGFYGKLDECLVTADKKYTPIDHKTSSSDPRQKETLSAYQSQLDAYSFLLELNKKDDILIATNTMPEYMPIIRKARAIVAEIGGVTCHAAIVSRELKKPCIIGVINATNIIKDGDLVEVDANNGVVKILKK